MKTEVQKPEVDLRRHVILKVHTCQDESGYTPTGLHNKNNVHIDYIGIAEKLVEEDVLEHGDKGGYKPGPKFEEALKGYGLD